MADYETLLVRKDDGVAWVSLARPAVRNAINQQMQDELRDVWIGFRYDDEVRCVVLTGEGESFCTGVDRAEAVSEDNNAAMAAGDYPGYPTPWMYDDPGRDVGPKSCDLWKPVIAAVQAWPAAAPSTCWVRPSSSSPATAPVFFDPRHLRDDRRLRADADALEDALPGDHAPLPARGPRADVGRAGARDRPRDRGRARDELLERAGWAARVIADSPPLVIQGTMRALWTALEVRAQAIGLANLFTRIGSDAAAFKAGQDRFASGERVQWRKR